MTDTAPETPAIKSFDKANLYRVDMLTDFAAGDLRVGYPVLLDGTDDPMRSPRFFSSVQAMIGGRPMPISFEIHAATLEGAIDGFARAAQDAAEKAQQQIHDRMLRNSLVLPGNARPA